MPSSDPKKNQSDTSGSGQKAAYPLDRYTVSPKSESNGGGEKSSYFQSAAPSISLPKGGGALKGIDEKFTVNAVNGTAALQVPLPLSPGRNGFTPNLSLQYNSGSGNSEFGLGWSLSLPAIQRKTDKKLPQYDDANESDIFVMAGAEDLQPLLIFDGTDWVPDIIIDGLFTIKRYRPRIEGLFARIERITKAGSPEFWWKVTTKENIVTYYGLYSDARISDPANENRIFKWLPQISFDNKGNVQQYFYRKENKEEIVPALHERNRLIGGAPPFVNVYLKSVGYCNIVPFSPSNAYQPTLPNAPEFSGGMNMGYQMQAVMDYGDRDPDSPTPYSFVMPWPCRKDPFSDFHAGFEIRTYRKCYRVLMFHYFDEIFNGSTPSPGPGINPSCLVRSLDFTYAEDTTLNTYAETDLITSITQKGYTRKPDATYFSKSLPAMTLGYAPLQWNNTVQKVLPADVENAPQGLTGSYQWIDMWGEGLPGILTEQAQGWFYKRNLGDGHFNAAVAVASKPSIQGLGNSLQWQDLDADGRRQLVSKSGAMPGYFELDDDQQWQPYRAFKEWVNVDWDSPYTRMLDLNGDGRPDILLTEERAWRWYENAGTEGFTEGGYGAVFTDEEKGPRLLHNDMMQVIFLADMNGDGITDIVRIQNGEVCYWPNIGYGRFGARVTMSNAPWFDTADLFNPQYITLSDIGGTGAADIIYIGREKCTAWVNLAGNAWSEATDICPLPGVDQYSKITVADFLGNGTSCIVWSSPLPQHAWAPMRYIDLLGGNKPYLMTAYNNGMGKETMLNYKQSTKYYLADARAGLPWATRLPFPVHCVSSIVTSDSVSQTSYTQTYSYHHGYYDHEEREFRGFGRVDSTDTDTAEAFEHDGTTEDELDQAPVYTRTWYHTGAWMREGTLLDAFSKEYYPTTWAELPTIPVILPLSTTSFSAQDQREAYRALKGQPLRQEVYALDGSADATKPYTVATHAYAVQQVQPVAENRYGSFYSYNQQSLNFSCERNVNDPRVMHELTLAVDLYGNVLQSAKVCYPRTGTPTPPVPAHVATVQAELLATYTNTVYTNDILTNGYHLRMPCKSRSFELTGLVLSTPLFTPTQLLAAAAGATEIEFADTPATGSVYKRVLSDARTLYLSDDTLSILTLGIIQSLGIPYQQYHLAFTNGIRSHSNYYNGVVTDSMLTEGGFLKESTIPQFGSSITTNHWLPGGTVTYDASFFYTPIAYTDPWGNTTLVTYWDTAGTNYYLLPQTVTDAVGNVNTVNAYNWYNLQPVKITDQNNNVSELLFDALGMPVAMAVKGKDDGTEGDQLTGIDPDDPTDITNQAAFFTAPDSVASDLLNGATWRCVYDLHASPVAVGMIARRFHSPSIPPIPILPVNMLMRLTYTDGFGRIAMHKQRAAPAEGSTVIRWIGTGKTVYNNKGSVVMQYEPYFSATPSYDPAEQAAMLGVTPRVHYDPLDRVLRTDLPDGSYTKTVWDSWRQATYDNNDTVLTSAWYAAASIGTPQQQDAAIKAAKHDGTPTVVHLDTLARPFYTIQNNRIADSVPPWTNLFYESYTDLDITGNRDAIHDARGLTPLTYTYNMLKGVVRQVSMDSGTQVLLTDAAGQPLYSWDADNRLFHITYDAVRRQLTKEATYGSPAATRVLERLTYGEGVSGAAAANLNGMLYESYDGVGYKKVISYDFKGNMTQMHQKLLDDPTITDVDWDAAPLLNAALFYTFTQYDAFSRPEQISAPNFNVTRYFYEQTGYLFSLFCTASVIPSFNCITSIYYDAKGQRQTTYYGNGTKTVYSHDPNTFRLTRLRTTKGTDVFQDLNYWYDPVGNITTLADKAQRSLYFNNSVTLPQQLYTYDALYRLLIATGREQIGVATFGADDNYNDSAWMGISQPGDDSLTQNYTQKYTYDEVGNITKLQHIATAGSYTRYYNYSTGVNRLHDTVVGANTYSYAYDNRGNMIQMPHLAVMDWNAENQFCHADLGGGGDVYYQYSGGERARKTVINGAITEQRIYFGRTELYRKYISGVLTLERNTIHAIDDTGRMCMVEYRTVGTDPAPAILLRFIYNNHIGTATLELDDTAAIISYEEYHPYGTTAYQATNAAINAVAKRYRYTGKERDEETGLYYMSARYYAPWLTRWMACDPINNEWYNLAHGQPKRNIERQFVELTASNYEYCYANPMRFTDPTGEQAPGEDLAPSSGPQVPKDDASHVQKTLTKGEKIVPTKTNIAPLNITIPLATTDNFTPTPPLMFEKIKNLTPPGYYVTSNSLQYLPPPLQEEHKQWSIRKFEEAGLTPDGQPTFLTKLAQNKHWQGFANNLVFPTIAMAGMAETGGMLKNMLTLPPKTVNISEIHFMQNSIKNTTGEYTVLGNANALKDGTLNPQVLTMNVWKDGAGKIWSLDNRRLASFKLSGLQEAPVNWANPTGQMWKMTTTTEGTSIKLKFGAGNFLTVK